MKTLLATLALLALGQEKPVDLIAKAELGDAKAEFGWKAAGKGVLEAKANFPIHETVVFGVDKIPDEYDLVGTIERLDKGTHSFHVGIVTSSSICSYEFDAFDAKKNAIAMIEGQWGDMVDGQFFRKGKARTFTLQIRKDGLTVLAEGKKFWKGRVDWSRCNTGQGIKLADKNHLFLSAPDGAWKVSSFVMVPR